MKKPVFTGTGTALITPFKDGGVDYDTMKKLIDFQISGQIQAIILCGTTGEAATLSNAEHEEIYNICTEYTNSRATVICGIGSNNTKAALNRAKEAEEAGADGVLMVTPYYNKTTQQGLIEHFYYVADRIDIPLIVYNVPSRSGIGIEPETYIHLAEHPNINGVKEASGSLSGFAKSIALCGDKLNFWSGNDSDTVGMMALGAKGVISVASNLLPDAVSALTRLCLEGSFFESAALNAKYAELFSCLFIEVNPIPIKAAMNMLGLCSDELRLPLSKISVTHRAALRDCLNRLGV